ncbi:MAG: hypothetical protein FD122_2664 [Stygiobacter sp.]|nr:MAG: hypothetical protein FD122_2664 [Stygiobacter sp.]KAF0215200.1 MAG: hypothetical protein FD178_1839 [Ignavibacteria bacterium]
MSDDTGIQIEELKQSIATLQAEVKQTIERTEKIFNQLKKERIQQRKESIQYKNRLLYGKFVLIYLAFATILRYENIKKNNHANQTLQQYCLALQCFSLIQAQQKIKEYRWIYRTKATELSYQLLLKTLKQL